MHRFLVIASGTIVILMGSTGAPVVTITNHSTNALNTVVLLGTGFTNRIESIAVGAKHKFTLIPTGDLGLRVTFDSGGRHIDAITPVYIATGGGYRVAVTVWPDLKLCASSKIKGY